MFRATTLGSTEKRIKVLVIDDSALMRHVLSEILSSDSGIDVIGVASDPYDAREKIKRLNPDVLTLDVEMPKMDGLQFLKNLMRLRPMPVVMVSSLTQRNAAVTLEALALGAVDFVSKPEIDIASKLKEYASEIIEKVKVARLATVTQLVDDGAILGRKHSTSILSVAKTSNLHFKTTDQIIAIGASTGGTEAIREVLERLPIDTPGTVIVQHIPGMFSGPFAERMNKCSAMTVCEAQDGQRVLHGHAYIAPGDSHLSLRRDGARYYCVLSDHDPVNRHRPSVDVLFNSVAQYVGKNAVGVILTGMGKDGAAGLKAMREAGANTVVQDEASSVVWGMPGAAVALNAADEVLSLTKIPNKIMALYQEKRP
ncbi:Chemotaxis response regulator protein-glutamate methylesterase [Zhongshania aliphaticivorans]|uniref:Protein-glutamate methylesterase/protein-glutamine glutaminase n=1 Tax=Zhongshania aliphaticivorans TaxID=1470434 RepID=A0A5S9P5I1_9GAMM|nr:chemotaxis response regulator protein-glutamate methylesterase [Zhongshania aliphaticivorans]CAA0091178.1 Chemotaxis response regulator protein-glutamate methylesterase [Zhongshania aliphaticivorans]CAA0098644.1 Chemotaxis response regulator protein-glutamate methylesterase [Zhongshania aliphaticivorans]